MRFLAYEYFYLMLAVPLVVAFGVATIIRRRKAMRAVAEDSLFARLAPAASLEREVLKLVLIVVALILIIIALSRPQFGTHSTMVKRRGLDVVVALDISKSMLARDISSGMSGDRLKRAKMEVQGLIDRLDGDRIGLVGYAGVAFVQCPLTSDYAAAKLFLRAMNVGSIPVGGTNIEEALRVAREMFASARGGSRSKVVVLISDGEDHEGHYKQEVEHLRDLGVIVHTIGVGTQIGELIPGEDGKYLHNEGKAVMTRLQENTLKSIADSTSGLYIHSAAGDLGFTSISEMLSRLQKSDYEARFETVFEEKFQVFAFVGLLFLIASTLIPRRRVLTEKGEES
jgi:Ca-activated chloride channel family protein